MYEHIAPSSLILSRSEHVAGAGPRAGVKTSCQSNETINLESESLPAWKQDRVYRELYRELSHILIPTLRQKSLFALSIESKYASRAKNATLGNLLFYFPCSQFCKLF